MELKMVSDLVDVRPVTIIVTVVSWCCGRVTN